MTHIPYTSHQFAHAKDFVFRMWCQLAIERDIAAPDDLSGACKYGSLFVRELFGGEIEGNYSHQFNRVDGRLIDLSHDARDVGLMLRPYQHDPDYFDIPEYQQKLAACMPRIDRWVSAWVQESAERHAKP
jgi:hypothetical protein